MKYQKLKKIFFFFLILIFAFLAKERTFAQINLGIYPQKLDLVLFPGDSYEGTLKITNYSKMALPLSLKISPFGAEEGSGEMRFEKIESDSPVFWFSFEKKEMILEPNETERINFKIEIPSETKPAGYYLFIYFEPILPSTYFVEPGPKVVPMIGIPVLISTTENLLENISGKEIEVIEFSISKKERAKILENSFNFVFNKSKNYLAAIGVALAKENPEILITKTLPQSFFVKIKNNDIYHLKPFGKISLYDFFGRKIGQGELKGQTILPGKTREFEIFLEKKNFSLGNILTFLFLGKTKAKLEIKAQGAIKKEIVPLVGNFYLTFFSLNFVYFILIFAIILLIIFFLRKRLKIVIKVLLKK